MRVLVVVHAFPPGSEGGCEVYVQAQARALARRGDDVVVLAREADPNRSEYAVRREERDGLRIAWVNNTFLKTRSFEESYRSPAIAAVAARLIDEFRPEVAHVHHLTCLSTLIVPALVERGIPCFVTLHDYWFMCHRGQLLDVDFQLCDGPGGAGFCRRCIGPAAGLRGAAGRLVPAVRTIERALPAPVAALGRASTRWCRTVRGQADGDEDARRRTDHMREICSQVTAFFAPSDAIARRFVAFGIPADRIVETRLGFELERWAAARRTSRRERRPLRLGFLGSLMISKAPHLLPEACRDLVPREVTIDLIGPHVAYHGDDSYRHRLTPLLAQDGVRHHGPLPHDRVAEALASLDLLVVPSIWPENSPLVLREAFLCGVPVIASRIGGIPEIVQDGVNGLLFEPGRSADLRRVIHRVLREPGLLDTLRAGIGAVRPIDDDVSATRAIYEAHGGTAPTSGGDRGEASRRVAAVIVNHRTPDHTLLAVRSLLASRRPIDEIIVVDNDAEGSAREAVDRLGRGVRYLHARDNLGFSGGVNLGVRAALAHGASAVLLVNSDSFVPPDCVERLEEALWRRPGTGIAAPVVAARSDPGQVASLGISYNAGTGRMRHRGVGEAMDRERADETLVDAASGCLVLVRRQVFEAIGFFDEDYFFSFEDIDFCLRARRAGFATVIAGRASVYHEGGVSIGARSPARIYFATRNHLLLASRTTPTSRVRHAGRVASILALNLAHAVRAPGASPVARIGAMVRGTWDYLAARYGAASSENR